MAAVRLAGWRQLWPARVIDTQEYTANKDRHRTKSVTLENPTILIVDDEPLVRTIHAKLCQQAGYTTTVAEDGVEALTMATAHAFGVILTDYEMPKMNGVEFCRQLRQLVHHRNTPLIVASSAIEKLPIEALTAEISAITFVRKPFNISHLPALL